MTKKATIVILENDRALLDVMKVGLEEDGYDVVPVPNPAQLSDALESREGRVILVADRDIGDEGANGFDIAASALERFPALRVVYVSGTHIAVRRLQLSARERSLLKPFAISQLVSLLRQLS